MSSVFHAHARQLVVLTSLFASTGAPGCNAGFSSCEELATCAEPSGEGGAGGRHDGEDGGAGARAGTGDAPADAGASGDTGASGGGASGDAGSGDAGGRAGAEGIDEGEAGAGGEGGDGAEPTGGLGGVTGEPMPECESDAVCDDGLTCNGVERCVDGACEPGETVECPSAGAGCEARCLEQEPGPGCVTRAADADADGHGSSSCEASPGDDCNDEDANVHAGAPELCDALDNDCDGSADLSDGLSLASSGVRVGGFSPSVVWSEHHGAFGLIWVAQSDGASQLRGGMVSTAGVLLPWPAVTLSSTSAAYLSPALVENGTGFAVLYQTGSRGGQLGHFAMLGTDGSAQSTRLEGLHSDVTPLERGMFMFAGELSSSLTIETLPAGAVERSSFETVPISPRIAAVGADAAVIWQVENTTHVEGLLYLDGRFVEPSFGAIENAAAPDITASGDGYVAAWSTPNGVFQQRLSVDGGLPCIGTEVWLPSAAISDRAVAIAATDRHAFVLVTDKLNGIVSVLRFDDQCQLIDQAEIDTGAVPSRPAIAVGGGHVAACWSEGTSDNHSECRVMGENLCDEAAGRVSSAR